MWRWALAVGVWALTAFFSPVEAATFNGKMPCTWGRIVYRGDDYWVQCPILNAKGQQVTDAKGVRQWRDWLRFIDGHKRCPNLTYYVDRTGGIVATCK